MALRKFNPVTKSRRSMLLPDFKEVTKTRTGKVSSGANQQERG